MSHVYFSEALQCWPTAAADLCFVSVQRKALGRELFELVAKTLGIREVTYFGLLYVDAKGYKAWLKDDKRVSHGVLVVLHLHTTTLPPPLTQHTSVYTCK